MNRLKCCVALILSLVFGLSGVLQPFALYAETLDLAQEQPKVSQPATESASNVSTNTAGDQVESDSVAQDSSTPDSSETADGEAISDEDSNKGADEASDEASDDGIEAPWLRTLGVMSTVPSAPIFLTIMAQMQISKAVQCTACLRAPRRRESM